MDYLTRLTCNFRMNKQYLPTGISSVEVAGEGGAEIPGLMISSGNVNSFCSFGNGRFSSSFYGKKNSQ